jgi:hypothetical protein
MLFKYDLPQAGSRVAVAASGAVRIDSSVSSVSQLSDLWF